MLIPSDHIDFAWVELSNIELMVREFFGVTQLLEVKLVAERLERCVQKMSAINAWYSSSLRSFSRTRILS